MLMTIMNRRIRDRAFLGLIERVLESGAGLYQHPEVLRWVGLDGKYRPDPRKGLPIGNLTSQFFANLYLAGLDQYAKRVCKIPLYLRYMDDLVIFGASRAEVDAHRGALSRWLKTERKLKVHARGKAQPTRDHFRFLGYIVDRNERRVARRAVRRLQAKLRGFAYGGTAQRQALAEQTRAVVRSWVF